MSGTKQGGLKARDTNIKKFGEDFYVKIGAEGGKAGDGKKKGFAAWKAQGREDKIIEAGRKGGYVSRRGPAKPKPIKTGLFDGLIAYLSKFRRT